jgi:hypothetical protein
MAVLGHEKKIGMIRGRLASRREIGRRSHPRWQGSIPVIALLYFGNVAQSSNLALDVYLSSTRPDHRNDAYANGF